MICKVLETVARYEMLAGASSVCVGVSGGMDSVCLLHLLLRLQPQFGYSLQAVHVNHMLRGAQADADARFVQTLCEQWKLPCTVVKTDVDALSRDAGVGVEEAGRQVRYAAFAAAQCDRIAVAHTLSDRVETSLFHLARGTALKGAAGIPPRRDNVIRPLIDCTRQEVEAYIREHGLSYVTDRTNLTDDYTRNYLRRRVLAPLLAVNPQAEENWARFLNRCAVQQDYLETQAAQALQEAQTADGYSASSLAALHEALRSECVMQLLRKWMDKPPEARHVSLCLAAIEKGEGRVSLTRGRFFRVKDGVAFLERQQMPAQPYCITEENGAFQTPNGVYRLRKATPGDTIPVALQLDKALLNGPLVLRTRQPGDRYASPVRQGSKTLKKLFNEMKWPHLRRETCAVLLCADRIAWVEGIGASRAFAAHEDSAHRLVLQKEDLA